MYNFDDLGKKISEIDERIDALIAKTGLSYSEFAVLYTLAKDGRSTQKKISEEWLIPKQTVFNVCKDFRQKGLVQPSEQSADKRERAMSLTQKGRDVADPIVHASDELGERVFARLGEKKRPEAILATNALLRDLQQRDRKYARYPNENLSLLGLIKSFLSYIFAKMPANAYKTGASDKPRVKYSSQIRHTLTTFPALPKFTYSLAFFRTRRLKFYKFI